MFQSVIDHRRLQVVHDKFEFHLKLQIVNLCYYIAIRSLNYRETLLQDKINKARRNSGTKKNTT